MRRQNELFLAASEDIAKTGLGAHYASSREYMIKVWTDLQSRTVDVSQPDLQPWNTHFEPRWWESYRKAGAYHPSIF